MLVKLSEPVQREIERTIRAKLGETRVLDVFAVARDVRDRFTEENAALDDIARHVAQLATQSGYALELNRID